MIPPARARPLLTAFAAAAMVIAATVALASAGGGAGVAAAAGGGAAAADVAGAGGGAAVAAGTGATASDGDLDSVMGLLAERRHGRVEFVEQQFLAALNHPVESSGELRFDAPDRLEKRTLQPRPETLLLSAGELTVQRGAHRRVLDLQRYPQIQPFVESIRATLAGDRAALERVFHIEFSGSMERWTLSLVPLDQQMLRTVKQVQIEGSRDQLRKVQIDAADGDRSLMTLRPPTAP